MVIRSVSSGACVVPASLTARAGADERLEGARPVLLGAEQQADQVLRRDISRTGADGGRSGAPRRPVVRDVVAPEVELVADALLASSAASASVLERAGRVLPLALAADEQQAHRERSQSRWSPPRCST
jgi:hypothetical protein